MIHPLHYANQLIQARNTNQRQSRSAARLERVLVYRGLPSAAHDPKPYARNLAQNEWERDPRVEVTLRPLKYRYERTEGGRKATDAAGRPIIVERLEKGVDVLCALALIREARDPNIDVVILASEDTDLEPALDEALLLGTAKVETASWYDNVNRRASKEVRPRKPSSIWNTRSNVQAFISAQDRKDYI